MGETSPEWTDAGLPDECPECGEDTDLAAVPDETDDLGPVKATVDCWECGYSWEWERTADSDTTDEA